LPVSDLERLATDVGIRAGAQGCQVEIVGALGLHDCEPATWWHARLVHTASGEQRAQSFVQPTLTDVLRDVEAWLAEHEECCT
jgi:hypothetical protein